MKQNHPIIRLETEKDYRAAEEMTREAFWNIYNPGAEEHYFLHTMRTHPDFLPELSFVIELDGRIIGGIYYLKSALVDELGNRKEILSFGPIGILPEYQRKGYGKLLMEHSFAAAKALGYEAVVIFGNPGNYTTSGFKSCKKYSVCLEGDVFPTALLVRELIPGCLDGRKWYYHESNAGEALGDADAVAAFDKLFPAKEKHWMPSQEEFFIYSHSSIR